MLSHIRYPILLLLGALLATASVSFAEEAEPPAIAPSTAPTLPPSPATILEVASDQYVNLPIVIGAPIAEKYPPDNRSYELEVLRLINIERANAGLLALSEDAALTQAARRHAEDMAANTLRGHTGSDGTMPGDRMWQEGYAGLPWSEASSFNRPSPEAAVAAWMASSGHRGILLDAAVDQIGIGYSYNPAGLYQHTWVVDTGRSQ